MVEHPLDFADLDAKDLDRAAAMAAEAFVDSPPYKYICGPSAEFRLRFLRFLFARHFEMAMGHGCCRCAYERDEREVAGDGGRCGELVCFFMLVDQGGSSAAAPSICDLFRMGLFGSLVRFGIRPTWRMLQFTNWAEQVEGEILGGRRVIRLEGMIVLPARQGRGIGSYALARALAGADVEGLEVFLATQDARNVVFYGRLGFRVVREAQYALAGFHTWFMLRAPQAVGSPEAVLTGGAEWGLP